MVDVEFLARIPIFASLARDDLQHLAALWRPVVCEAGQLIFAKGDPPRAMYLIREGKIAISVWTEDNQELVLSILHQDEFFGELGVLDGSPRTATARVVDKAELVEMTRDDLLGFLRGKPDVAISMMGVIAQRLRTTNELIERRTARNVNEESERRASMSDRVADRLAQSAGSWPFILAFVVVMTLWMVANSLDLSVRFDPFPFIFLNLVLSCVAALQAPVIMMSQNRQTQKDRLRADLDYNVNLKAELQIQRLHVKMDELRASEIHELCALQHEQMATLRKQVDILQRMAQAGPA